MTYTGNTENPQTIFVFPAPPDSSYQSDENVQAIGTLTSQCFFSVTRARPGSRSPFFLGHRAPWLSNQMRLGRISSEPHNG
jgi:hypothetical protein